MKYYLDLLSIQTPIHSRSGLEHRTQFNCGEIEVNVFETFQSSTKVQIQYDGLSISSMIRGKKIVYTSDGRSYRFLPGSTLLLPEGETIFADFPEASQTSPVQCATLLISKEVIKRKLDFLNTHYPHKDFEWQLDFKNFIFNNNSSLVRAINELLQIATQQSQNIPLSDLLLKSLLVRIIDAQRADKEEKSDLKLNDHLFKIKKYIQEHLHENIKVEDLASIANMSESSVYRLFEEHFQLTPGNYLLNVRLNMAKSLLLQPNTTVSEVAYQCGFNSVSYFVKQFKSQHNCTPGDFIKKFGL
jgi:AraC-like DNA-binding protein